jgi:hypothetical protein
MASSLGNLPRELQLAIAEALVSSSNGHAAILEWSSTCSFYRSLLAPYVFGTVSLHNDEKCVSALFRIARGPYSEHVKRLVYSGFRNCASDKYDYHTFRSVFPSLVNEVLSELRQFPCLSTVAIRFPSDLYNGPCLDHPISGGRFHLVMRDPEDAKKNALAELLMYQTYKSLSQNLEHRITALEIENLELIAASAFSNEAFHRFLHSIQRFQLSLKEENDPYHENCFKDYQKFAANLGSYFFNHLHHVSELIFKGAKTGTISFTGFGDHGSSVLAKHQMPLLKRVHLEWTYICPGLVEFLVDKLATLESISLHECSASLDINDGLGRHGITWEVLFRRIINANASKLQRFTVTPHCAAEVLRDIFNYRDFEYVLTSPERNTRSMFRYADPNRIFGCNFINEWEIAENWIRGEDHKAYEELLEIVEGNALRISRSHNQYPSARL